MAGGQLPDADAILAGAKHLTDDQLALLAHYGLGQHLGAYVGPLLLGYATDSVFLGVLIQQAIWNVIFSPGERRFSRIVMLVAVGLSILMSVFINVLTFHMFVSGFGTWYRFIKLDMISFLPAFDVLCTVAAQVFYLDRAYQLHDRAKWVVFITAPFLITSLGAGVAGTIIAHRLVNAVDLTPTFPAFYVWLGCKLITDGLITSLIFYRLIKSRTGWSSTDYLIKKLIFISVETQLPALICSVAIMISYGVMPLNGINYYFELCQPKVYIIGLLAVLNSKQTLRKKMRNTTVDDRMGNTYGKRSASRDKGTATVDLGESYIPEVSAFVLSLSVNLSQSSRDETARSQGTLDKGILDVNRKEGGDDIELTAIKHDERGGHL
ncbi:hypothetical protein IAU60_003816 [Kwoniella sp. DSM 27419]